MAGPLGGKTEPPGVRVGLHKQAIDREGRRGVVVVVDPRGRDVCDVVEESGAAARISGVDRAPGT